MPVSVSIDDDGSHINIRSDLRFKELCRSIPGSNWNSKRNAWRLPLSWAACVQLKNTFGAELQPSPELTAWVADEYTNRIVPSMQYREMTATDEGDPDLFPHQRAGVQFLAAAKRALLADEPGLGKTAQAIRGLMELQRKDIDAFPALVVCPNTLKPNWKREIEKWWPGIRVQIIHGSAAQRKKQFDTFLAPKEGELRPHVFIINWENLKAHSRLAPYGSIALKRCVECGGEDPKVKTAACEVHKKELNQIEFRAVIADEAHRGKSAQAAQTRALWAATGNADIRFALTGTPQSGDVSDLWAIMHWLSPEEWPTKSKWIDRTVLTLENNFAGIIILGIRPEMQQEFFDILNPRMRRMLKKVVLPFLPPIMHQMRTIEMGAKQKKAYEQMEKTMIAEVEGGYLMATDPLTKATRLQQFAMASVEMVDSGKFDDEGEPVMNARLTEPSCTAEAVANDIIVGDFGTQSIAVMAVSSQLLELISARLTKADIPHGMITGDYSVDVRQNAIDAFQEGRTKVILYTAQAGGVGVTLTAASVLLRPEIPFSLIDYTQGNDRVHRIGSEIHDSILVVDYYVKDSVQYKAFETIERKQLDFEAVVRDQDQLAKIMMEE